MNNYTYTLDLQVRDYECDIQGIVNNATYQNYLEHTRHEFLKSIGINFVEFAKQKINLVVVRAELDYKQPLQSGDLFWVGINFKKESRIKFAFLQDIYRHGDNKLIMKAKIIGTALNPNGRPYLPQELEAVISTTE